MDELITGLEQLEIPINAIEDSILKFIDLLEWYYFEALEEPQS